jgi:hypothetical protein
MVGGLLNTITSGTNFVRDPSVSSGLDVADGLRTTLQHGAEFMGKEGFAEDMEGLGTVIDFAQTDNDWRKGDYENFVKDGVSTSLDVADPGLSQAWKMGWAGGKIMHGIGNSQATRDTNVLGHNDNLDSFGQRMGQSSDRDIARWTGSETAGHLAGAWMDAQAQMIGLAPSVIGAGVGKVQNLFGHKHVGNQSNAVLRAAQAEAGKHYSE